MLKEGLKKQKIFLDKKQFDDSFKGIFGIKAYNEGDIKKVKKLIENLLKTI